MPVAPNLPVRKYAYVRSVDVATYIGNSGPLLSDAQQRKLIGEAYSQNLSNLFLYSFDGTITSGVFSAAAKLHLITFIRLCIPWGIRIGIPMGNISNTKLGAIYDFNNSVATSASETIDYVLEDEFWNNGYGDFVRVRDAQTFWHANLLLSGARSFAYTGHTKINGESYDEDFAITGAAVGVGTVTFTTSVNHNFIAGGTCELVGVSGFSNNPNGQFVMTAAAGNTFQISHFAGAGSYAGGATVSSVYVGTTEIRELQSLFDEWHLHAYSLIPYHRYQQRREAEFTIPVDVVDLISTESTTATPPQANNFSGNILMGENAAGVPSYPVHSIDDMYQYINIDTNALGYSPSQVAGTPRFFNADTTPSIVANVTKVGISVFTFSFLRDRIMTDGTRIMVHAGVDQSSSLLTGSINLSDAYSFDDWLPIGSSLVYTWSVITAPPGATVQTFSNANALNPSFTYSAPGLGNWRLQLSVTDGVVTSTDTMDLFITGAGAGMTVSLAPLKTITCNGDSDGEIRATVVGGAANYTYAYSNGVTHPGIAITTDDLTGLVAGTYSVTVTDSLGEVAVDSITINNPPALVIDLVPTNPSCPGASDGEIEAIITGGSLGIASIDWTDNGVPFVPADPENLVGLNLGRYEVTVEDNNGCIRTASVNLIEPTAIVISGVVVIDPVCYGDATGSIEITTSGGTGFHSYSWLDPVTNLPYVPPQTGTKIENLTADNYTVIVTDENGCTQSFVISVNDPPPIIVDIEVPGGADFCLSYPGYNEFTATVLSGGVGPFRYEWTPDTDLTFPTYPNVAVYTPTAGGSFSFTVTVTDSNLCQGFATVAGTVFPGSGFTPIITASGILGSCAGDSITLTVTNAASFASLLWNTSESTNSIVIDAQSIIDFGNIFSVEATDVEGGCLSTGSIEIAVTPTTIQLVGITNNACGGDDDAGAINITTFGGCAPYTWVWTDSNGDTVATTEDIASQPTGQYTIVATDDNGQTASATYNIYTSSPQLSISFTNINGLTGGTATATVTGAASPYTIIWTDPNGTTYSGATITDLFVEGIYRVTVTDANDCTASDIVCISRVYSFGMSECEFKCFLQQMSCCQADMVYKMIEADRGGKETCVQKVELMETYLELLECYYPEGSVIRAGSFAYYALTINSYSNGGTLVITLLGTTIVNYTFDTGVPFEENLDNIVALVVAAGMTASYSTDGSSYATLIINAPVIGAGYNCVTMTVTNTSSNIVVLTEDGFTGGVDEVIADPPCLSDDDINNIIEQMRCLCNCDCTNLSTLTSDNLIY